MPVNEDTERRAIALIGSRGAGKTAVGRALAELIGGTHVDTDDLIVERALTTILRIFKEEGEAGFRQRECDAIAQIVLRTPDVISVGGGAVCVEDNVKKLRSVAKVVWLTAPVPVLWQRINGDPATGTTRPSLTKSRGRDEVEILLAQRSDLYRCAADVTVDTMGKTPAVIAGEVARALGLHPGLPA